MSAELAGSMERSRVAPRSLESEQSLLGGLLQDNRQFDAVAGLVSEDDFFVKSHADIWSAMALLVESNKPADVVTVYAALTSSGKADDETLDYLHAMVATVPSATNAMRYAEIIRDRSMQRKIIRASQDIDAIAWGDGEASEKLDKAAALLAQLDRGSSAQDPKMLSQIVHARIGYYNELIEGTTEPATPTGICDLDNALAGGLRPGKVYVLAARPSVGKSSFAMALGLHVAKLGKRVLMLSQEMPSTEVVDRALSNIGDVSYTRLQSGQFADNDLTKLVESAKTAADLSFAVDDQPSLRLSDIRSKTRWMRGCDLLIIDYVQLCASDESRDNRQAEIEQISRGLKELAKNLNLSVILLSQLNRKVEERPTKEPLLSDLRDSGAIEQDADVVVFLWPVKDYGNGTRLVGCKLEKNRQGRKARFGLFFNGDLQQWHATTESIDRQNEPNDQQPQARRKVT